MSKCLENLSTNGSYAARTASRQEKRNWSSSLGSSAGTQTVTSITLTLLGSITPHMQAATSGLCIYIDGQVHMCWEGRSQILFKLLPRTKKHRKSRLTKWPMPAWLELCSTTIKRLQDHLQGHNHHVLVALVPLITPIAFVPLIALVPLITLIAFVPLITLVPLVAFIAIDAVAASSHWWQEWHW